MIFKKILSGLNVEPIRLSLFSNPQLWDQNPQRRIGNGSPHSEMTDIWVRFGDTSNGDFSSSVAEHDSIWYPSADVIEGAKRIAFDVMAAVDGERLGGILITKLPPGGRIHPHSDSGWHAEYYEKFYVAISAPDKSVFGFDGGEIIADNGDCWLFRNNIAHWVINDSDQDRISMIICIKTDKFMGAA
jgi:quercetin dioxygenase-like cupin family protein